ncbi:MAG: hypothetical protein M1812_006761 [Candelaria pacifica]|nr:MAG: hypothetical protein M1812_006761 [Candelaria pacifica]
MGFVCITNVRRKRSYIPSKHNILYNFEPPLERDLLTKRVRNMRKFKANPLEDFRPPFKNGCRHCGGKLDDTTDYPPPHPGCEEESCHMCYHCAENIKRIQTWLDEGFLEVSPDKVYTEMYIDEQRNSPPLWSTFHDVWLLQHAYTPSSHKPWNPRKLVLGLATGYGMGKGAITVAASEQWVARRLDLLWVSGLRVGKHERDEEIGFSL